MGDNDSNGARAALPPAFREAMAKLEAEFDRQLPGLLAEAQSQMRSCQADPADDAKLKELHRLVHRLAGSAGTFGRPVIGQHAKAIESLILALQKKDPRAAGDFDAAAAALARLADEGGPR